MSRRRDWTLYPIPMGYEFGFMVRNNKRIQFWHDARCSESVLLSLFPKLFQLSTNKGATVSNYMNTTNRIH
jgi:hypothetical protein